MCSSNIRLKRQYFCDLLMFSSFRGMYAFKKIQQISRISVSLIFAKLHCGVNKRGSSIFFLLMQCPPPTSVDVFFFLSFFFFSWGVCSFLLAFNNSSLNAGFFYTFEPHNFHIFLFSKPISFSWQTCGNSLIYHNILKEYESFFGLLNVQYMRKREVCVQKINLEWVQKIRKCMSFFLNREW